MDAVHTKRKPPQRVLSFCGGFCMRGAVDEARTRDPQLGKLMLYQLSYYRVLAFSACKGNAFFRFGVIYA